MAENALEGLGRGIARRLAVLDVVGGKLLALAAEGVEDALRALIAIHRRHQRLERVKHVAFDVAGILYVTDEDDITRGFLRSRLGSLIMLR